jgi:hypothetical protein
MVTNFITDHFPPLELPADQTKENFLENLQKQYGDQLCVRIESGLGYVSTSSPQNEINRYVECRNSKKQGNSYVDKSEEIEINGTVYNAKGFEVTGFSEDLSSQNEAFHLILPNGIYVEYGFIVKANTTFDDYQI